jgi:hypothetical protein
LNFELLKTDKYHEESILMPAVLALLRPDKPDIPGGGAG